VTDRARLEFLLLGAPGSGQLGTVSRGAQSQRVQRGRKVRLETEELQPFGHGGAGVGWATLQQGQLGGSGRQRSRQPRLGHGLREGIMRHP
jgi:hypothetical protein